MHSTATATAPSELCSLNPATGEPVGSVPITPVEEIDSVVARGRAAQGAWAELSVSARSERLRPLGRTLVGDAEELGILLSDEMGKPRAEAVGEVRYCGSKLETTLDGIIAALAPETFDDGQRTSEVHYDPLGVCAAITPWNFPLAMPHSLVIPALTAGNTVVLKPSEETPLMAQAYAERLQALLPEGVLQIVHGDEAQGKALVASDVDLVAFTGSREAGQHIMAAAGRGLKRIILELGGKDPLVVLADADIDAAAEFAAHNAFRNAGQVCVSTERIYVDEQVADDFERALIAKTEALSFGPGSRPDVRVGPMINARQRDHVVRQVAAAREAGADLRVGTGLADGNLLAPMVLTGVDHGMEIMREETFGPVACVMRFADENEAVRLANDTPFGLGAAVFGGDDGRARGVARRLTAGMVGINQGCGGASGTPWVGAGQSGFGFHSGRDGHRQFTQPRVISRPR